MLQTDRERTPGCCLPFLPSSSCFVISRIVLHERCDQLEKSQERFNCEIYLMKTSVYPHVSLAGHDLRTGLRLQLSKTEYQTTHARTDKGATPYLTQLENGQIISFQQHNPLYILTSIFIFTYKAIRFSKNKEVFSDLLCSLVKPGCLPSEINCTLVIVC